MSHGFLEFADFYGAWRYSSTPSIAIAQSKHITFAGTPCLVHIRAPASCSPNLSQPAHGFIAVRRRRAQSETTPTTTSNPPHTDAEPAAKSGAEPILVSFAPIAWTSAAEPHPGSPANLPRNEENEAVSPKSRLPGALKRTLLRRGGTEMSVRITDQPLGDGRGRMGSSVVAVKSPYPRQEKLGLAMGMEKVRRWVRGLVGKSRG